MPASGVHSGAAPQQPLRFEAVVAIHVDFRVAQCRALAGDVISAGLPALRTVGGTFHLFVMGTRGAAPGSELVLSELRSVGSLFFRAVAYSTISIPALANLTSGGIHLSDMYQLRHLDMASVEAMAGNFYVDSAPALASLCEFRLPASGWRGSRVQIARAAHLAQMPGWMARNASLEDSTTACSGLRSIVIRNQADYSRHAANASLVNARTIGSVVITWPAMTSAQLATLLQRKTTIEGLVIEDNAVLENLSPGLDAVVNITAGLVVSNMPALTEVTLPSLVATGGGLTFVRLPVCLTVSVPILETVGAGARFESAAVLVNVSAPALTVVNGSLAFSQCQRLPGSAISAGFSRLRAVGGQFQIFVTGQHGMTGPAGVLTMARLQSVGQLFIRGNSYSSVSFPVLTRIGSIYGAHTAGGLHLSDCFQLRSFNTPNLQACAGPIWFDRIILPSTCNLTLAAVEFTGAYVRITNAAALVEMEVWMAQNASLQGTTACPSRRPTATPTTPSPTSTAPTAAPSARPTSSSPTGVPTASPVISAPTSVPSGMPTSSSPTQTPSRAPATTSPTGVPTASPGSSQPTVYPTFSPVVSATPVPTTEGPANPGSSSASEGDTDSGDSSAVLIAVVVAVVLVFVVIGAAVAFVKKASQNDSPRNAPVGFDNPLYATAPATHPVGSPSGDQGTSGGYMDVPAGTSGYMDVAPGSQISDPRSQGSVTGYMDVAPRTSGEHAGFGDEDAEEDV